MFKLLCILNFLILVTSNPLQELTTCPVFLYQRKPEASTQTLNLNPYLQEHTVQSQLPSYQTLPYLYNNQIGELYLDKVVTNPVSSLVDPNTGLYNQNGYKIIRYVTNPGTQPHVVNNYIIVPPEYLKLNQNIANVLQNDLKDKSHKYLTVNGHRGNVKSKREDRKSPNDDNGNKIFDGSNNHDFMNLKTEDNNKVKKKKRKSSNNDDAAESSQFIEEEKRNPRTKKQGTLNAEKDETNNEHNAKTRDENSRKTSKKKSKRKRKNKYKKTSAESKCNELHEEVKSNDSPKDVTRKTADEEVGFDIYEDCECLVNRKTRNNCCQCQRNNHQQNYPRDFTENIVSYLNNLMSNPQFVANYFNPYGNFPYNFNYMNQMPQPMKTNESNKRCKNKRKKQNASKNESNTITIKPKKQNQDDEVKSNCEKVVELEPQFIEIEENNKPSIPEEIVNSLEHQDELVEEKGDKTPEIYQNVVEVPEITEPVILYADEESNENVYVPVSEEIVPFSNFRDIYDDYYPDFTLDNIYLSREEDDCDNFHDRHYYTSDSKAEMSRERRRYERVDGKKLRTSNNIINDENDAKFIKNDKPKQRKEKVKNIENSPEIRFRVPPPLEFPDFKTEMVNKDRFISPNNIYYNRDDNYENHRNIERYYGDVKPFYLDVNNVNNNEVETVYAHSKVVRYGAKPNEEETSAVFDFTEIKKDDKNLFSTDGETTIILARSLGYPEDYL